MTDTLRVARVDDTITHTQRKAAIANGTVIGLGVGILIAIYGRGSDRVAKTLFRGINEGGSLIGLANYLTTSLSNWVGPIPSGGIADGAQRTWTENKRNARITDPARCADPVGTRVPGMMPNPLVVLDDLVNFFHGGQPGEHVDAKVENGSETVFVEDRNASRLTEKTTCEGKIATAAQRTWMGGPSVTLSGYEGGSEEGAVIANTVWGIEWFATAVGRVLDVMSAGPFSVKTTIGASRALLRAGGQAFPEYRAQTDQASSALEALGAANDYRTGSGNPRRRAAKALTTALTGSRTVLAPVQYVPPPTRIVRYPG